MKSLAKFLVGLTAAILLLVGYYILSSRLSTSVAVEFIPAVRQQERFDAIAEDIRQGKYDGVSALGGIEQYAFVTVSAEADNFSLFTAEWAQFKLKELGGDALTIIGDAGPKDIPSFKQGAFSITLLTASDEVYREGWLEYYIFGRFHSLKVAPKSAQ